MSKQSEKWRELAKRASSVIITGQTPWRDEAAGALIAAADAYDEQQQTVAKLQERIAALEEGFMQIYQHEDMTTPAYKTAERLLGYARATANTGKGK